MSRRKIRVLSLGVSLPVFYFFWIIFVGTFALHELLLGAIGAALATTGLAIIDFYYPVRFSPSLRELLSLWRIPGSLVAGTWKVTAIAANDVLGIRRANSLFSVVRFDAGEKTDPHATARRVLAVVSMTVTPPTIVLGVNTSDQKLLFHELRRSPLPETLKALGVRA